MYIPIQSTLCSSHYAEIYDTNKNIQWKFVSPKHILWKFVSLLSENWQFIIISIYLLIFLGGGGGGELNYHMSLSYATTFHKCYAIFTLVC